jgi:hypothetical protein
MGIPEGRTVEWVGCEGGLWTYPDVEVELVVCYGLDVESDGWYCGYDFADLEGTLALITSLISLSE